MRKGAAKRAHVEAGSGNVFADLGLPDAAELDTKARLAVEIDRLIAVQGLTPSAAAARLDVGRSKITALRNYRLDGFSVERLMSFVTALEVLAEIPEHDTKHVTPAGRSALLDLASDEDAIKLEMCSALLRRLAQWLASSDMTQIEAATVLGITRARVLDLRGGKISRFSLDVLIRLATRARLQPRLMLAQ